MPLARPTGTTSGSCSPRWKPCGQVYERLKSDKKMTAPWMQKIAKAFADANEKKRGEALHKILMRHQRLVGIEARAEARGGRTAA
jgi:hypothetical protein